MNLERLNNLQLAGFVIGIVGGLLALIPYVEQLIEAPQTGWVSALMMTPLSAAGLVGVILSTQRLPVTGGILAAIAGLVIAIIGPVTAGVLLLVGGVLLLVSAREVAAMGKSESPEPLYPPKRTT